jgi:flavin-binding monooxygenase-like protein
VLGRIDRRGLSRPDHALLFEPPIINSLLFYLLEHGRVAVAPDVVRLDADGVIFRNGRRESFDTILWATGYKTIFPFLEEGHLDWANGVPLRLGGGAIAARAPGLYFNGLASPRGGNLPMHSACAELIAECVRAQRMVGGGLLDELRKYASPVPLMDGSVPDIIADARHLRRIAAACHERQRKGLTA